MGSAAPKPPHAIHPHSKLWGILAFSHEGEMMDPISTRIMRKLIPILLSSWSAGSLQQQRARQEKFARYARLPREIQCSPVMADGVPAEWIEGPGARQGVLLYLHGGAYHLGSIHSHREMVARLAHATRLRALAVEYRLAPEHPFPAALEDVITTFDWLLKQGWNNNQIIFAGDSAGGGLALAGLLSLRDDNRPLPAGAACFSPWTDLTCSGKSMQTKARVDQILNKRDLLLHANQYAGTHDPRCPTISPLFADLRGLPPLLIQAGSEEILLDDSTRFAERAEAAGIAIRLEVFPGAFHVFPMVSFLPETKKAVRHLVEFATKNINP